MKLLPTLLAALALTLSARADAPSPTEAEAGIGRLRDGLIDSFAKADIDRLVTYLAPDVVVTWQNGEVAQGPEGVRAYYTRMMKGDKPVVKEVSAQPEVLGRHLHGDWAFSWGNLHDRYVLADGTELKLDSAFTITTARQGDRWVVTGYHASVNAFGNPVLSVAVRKAALFAGLAGAAVGLLLGFVISRATRPKQA